MIDLQLLQHLETYLTDHRLARFKQVLNQRTKHFTVATEDVYQLHNTSAVMRTCDVFGLQEFGRETEGLSDAVLNQADSFLKIPMVGFTESLNISVSAAIILQHATSKLKKTDINWQLTEDEKLEKRLDWCKKTIKSYDDIVARFYSDKS